MARYHSPWKPEEEELLIQLKNEGLKPDEIKPYFPHRSKGAIQRKAHRLGLVEPRGPTLILLRAGLIDTNDSK